MSNQQTVKLTPITKVGVTLVRQIPGYKDGALWFVEHRKDSVSFSDREGPWITVRPAWSTPDGGPHLDVHETDDRNFKVEK